MQFGADRTSFSDAQLWSHHHLLAHITLFVSVRPKGWPEGETYTARKLCALLAEADAPVAFAPELFVQLQLVCRTWHCTVSSPDAWSTIRLDLSVILHDAVYSQCSTVVKMLLQAGIEPDATRFGSTPLVLGCFLGVTAIVQLLLDARADPNFEEGDSLRRGQAGSKPLQSAVDAGHANVVQLLVDAGVTTTAASGSQDECNSQTNRQFRNGCESQAPAAISMFKSSGKVDWGVSLLSHMLTAAQEEAAAVVSAAEAALEAAEDADACDLHWPSERIATVVMLGHTPSITGEDYTYCKGCNMEAAKARQIYVTGGDYPTGFKSRGRRLLTDMVVNGSFDAVKVLLDHGADCHYTVETITAERNAEFVPLHAMAAHNKKHGAAILKLIKAKGPNPNQTVPVQAVVSADDPRCRGCVLA